MTASGHSLCAPGTAPNRCGCRRMPCSSASAAPRPPTRPPRSGRAPAPPGTRCPAAGAAEWGLAPSLGAEGADVHHNPSKTPQPTGAAGDIERSGRYQPLRLRLYRMDREMQRREMRTLAAAPDYVVGSVHALTEDGSLLIASASGSQLGPLASGAGQGILVIGAQKMVPDVATGMRRIYEYCYPLEDARARQAYGVPSGANNILIINKVMTPGRITAIIVKERLGF